MNELIYTPNETYRATLTTADLETVLKNDFYDAFEDSNTRWPIAFTEFGGLTATVGDERQLLWPEFIQYIIGARHKPTSTKWGRLIGGYWLKENSARSNGAVEIVHMVILDVDAKPGNNVPSLAEMRARFKAGAQGIYGCKVLAYTTYNHALDNPRYRIILPLARGVAPNEYAALWGGINEALGGIVDIATKDISRTHYLPICPPERMDIADWFEANHDEEMLNPEPLIIEGKKIVKARPIKAKAINSFWIPSFPPTPESALEISKTNNALSFISADCSYEIYRDVIWAILSTNWDCAEDIARKWSLTAPHRFSEATLQALINSYSHTGGIHYGTLLYHARRAGYLS